MSEKPSYEDLEARIREFESESSQRKQAEEQNRRLVSILKATLASTADGIMVVSREGKIVGVNEKLEKMWGIPKTILASRDDNLFLGYVLSLTRDPEGFLDKVAELYTQPDAESHDIIEFKDGRIFDRYSQPQRIDGVSVGRVWSFRDLSEIRKSQQELKESFEKLRKAMGGIIQAMALCGEKRDPYTAGHQRRVADLARQIGAELSLPKERIDGIGLAGVIHDIGKIAVPADILSKPGRLTDNEFGIIKEHSSAGFDILKEIDFPWPIAEIVHQHHEKMDGTGYPQGLCGEAILLEARIVSVSDVVEAMASHRPYRAAIGIEKALEEIRRYRGLRYDRDVVDACTTVFARTGFKFV